MNFTHFKVLLCFKINLNYSHCIKNSIDISHSNLFLIIIITIQFSFNENSYLIVLHSFKFETFEFISLAFIAKI